MIHFFDDELLSRHSRKGMLATFGGPTIGLVEDSYALVSGLSNGFSEAEQRMARRLVPFQNMFYLRGLFDKVFEENE